MRNKLLVIGGSGFIGTRLCERLVRRNDISFSIVDKVESRKFPEKYTYFDIRNEIPKEIIDKDSIIINLAAEHHDNVRPVSLYYETNVKGAINICNLARKANVKKIIFTSSVAVYGFSKTPINESGTENPFNDYGRSKLEAEKIYKKWYDEDPKNRTLTILRPTVVFGEGNRGNVYTLINQIYKKKFIMIGNGSNYKSIAYVENVAACIEYSINFDAGFFLYNYTDKPAYSMSQLIEIICQTLKIKPKYALKIPFFVGISIGKFLDYLGTLLNKKFSISSIRIKKFCSNSVYDSDIFSKGFTPPLKLSEAIKKTIIFEFIKKTK